MPYTTHIVLTDSGLALEQAFTKGLGLENIKIQTSSPFLAQRQDLNVEKLEKNISQSQILALAQYSLNLSIRVFNAFNKVETNDYALMAAIKVHILQKWVYKAMALRPEHFNHPITIIEIESDEPKLKKLYNPPWRQILGANPLLRTISIPLSDIKSLRDEEQTSKFYKWRRKKRIGSSVRSVLNDLKNLLPVKSENGTILCHYRMNPLLKEISGELASLGFSIRSLKRSQPAPKAIAEDVKQKCIAQLHPIITEHLAEWVLPAAVAPLADLYFEELFSTFEVFEGYFEMWQGRLTGFKRMRPRAVLASFPTIPDIMALAKVCRQQNVLLVSAQHGMNREINALHRSTIAIYENNVADVLFTFNEIAAKVSTEENPFKRGQCIASGFPTEFLCLREHHHNPAIHAPIIYISNMLYMGNVQFVSAGGPDHYRAKFEMRMIKQVLGSSSHSVLFKARPSHGMPRYLDPDPIKECAKKYENIQLYEGDTDVIDMLSNHRVVITTVCTSTLGYCLISNLPLIFIDLPFIGPMKQDVRQEFEKAVFYFNAHDSNFHDQVASFLSQPLEKIESMWKEKEQFRNQFVEKYIAKSVYPNAGRYGANWLANRLRGQEIQS